MEFVSSHFGDSSDEEEAFMEGLTFEQQGQLRPESQHPPQGHSQPPPPAGDPIGQLMSSVIAQNAGNVLSALGQNLVTSVIGQASGVTSQAPHMASHQQPPPRMSRSLDSTQQSTTDFEDDFELISDEECQ